jgi:hypothetical protein
MLAYFSDKIITRNGIRRNLTSEIGFPIIGQQYEFTLKTQNIFNIKQYIYITTALWWPPVTTRKKTYYASICYYTTHIQCIDDIYNFNCPFSIIFSEVI